MRFYLGGCYEHDKLYDSSGKNINREERLYIGGDYYSASAVYIVRESPSNDKGLYYIIRDYLGSIRCLVRADGMKYIQPCYDAWGRIKHPISHEYCDPEDDTTSPPNLLIGRGYCGHEYLPQFGLINMNARLYDPILGRFLSPDSQLQLPYNSQNFNRYTYGLNNPLYYIDQDGEFFFIPILVAAGIGGAANLICKGLNGQIHNIGDAFSAFGIGAVAGGVGFATGGWAAGLVGGAAGGFFTGAIGGFVGSAASMPFLSVGNNQAFGDPLFTAKEYAIGIVSGSLLGGMYSGMKALYDGRNFWNGNEIQYGRNAFSINNTPLPKPSDAHYTLYRGIGDNGSDYVGMTGREPEIRISEHLRSKTLRSGLSYKISASNFTKIEARIWEQRVINSHKQGILDVGCINMRNEISPTLWHSYRIPPPSSWNQIYKFRISFELKTRIRMF